MARIVTVYSRKHQNFAPSDMSYIRWLKISEALARLGHHVDIATNEFGGLRWWRKRFPIPVGENLRRVPLSEVRWHRYDVVKTLFHHGFDTLEKYGGSDHPFIISKLGSVVGPVDMEGIYFYGKSRKRLYLTQKKIDQKGRYITLLNDAAKELWISCFGPRDNILIVPGGVEKCIPTSSKNPYPPGKGKRCVFAGNIYGRFSQPDANKTLVNKLNRLGKLLKGYDIQLYMIGAGNIRRLDRGYVNHLGVVPHERAWDYFHYAHAGVVVAAGGFMHNNESSKIYHYLRAGLPVVSESGFPNDHIVRESRLGFAVENGNMELMAEKIHEAADKDWDRDYAVSYILNNHTWDKRAEVYNGIIKEGQQKRL
ncbi:hypothetical protein BMS3Bbin06_01259 [bacterium BMS3Bbin06]|nr:hypothetical protein BMS3Abin08_00706 [bacterium BMS3Abin08]GBE34729.1 hypothetical protein BMS3Bbin06_01259 [bacterium BMS3Bbin06]